MRRLQWLQTHQHQSSTSLQHLLSDSGHGWARFPHSSRKITLQPRIMSIVGISFSCQNSLLNLAYDGPTCHGRKLWPFGERAQLTVSKWRSHFEYGSVAGSTILECKDKSQSVVNLTHTLFVQRLDFLGEVVFVDCDYLRDVDDGWSAETRGPS